MAHMWSIYEKKQWSKISCYCPFKHKEHIEGNLLFRVNILFIQQAWAFRVDVKAL
jgi:hypothetical protein